jgi:hypothetical protein
VSSQQQKLEVLQQIPEGSIPITKADGKSKAFLTKTSFVEVGGFSTQVLDSYFYFPSIGLYNHYPVHVSKNGKVIGTGVAMKLEIVEKFSALPDLTSWRIVSQEGTDQQVINYIKEQNVHKLDLTLIAWRMHNNAFFKETIAILRSRFAFNHTLWGYSVHHKDSETMSEFLSHTGFTGQVGPYFDSAILAVDHENYIYNQYQHLEYAPLLNARAHQLRSSGGVSGSSSNQSGLSAASIQNVQFRAQYKRFLNYLLYRVAMLKDLSPSHIMCGVYYMLLQDRIDEARELFSTIDAKTLAEDSKAKGAEQLAKLHYDYMFAYLSFFDPKGSTADALQIAKKYRNYPVVKKRKLFEEIEQQILEAQPHAVTDVKSGVEGQSREREMANLAQTEPSLDFSVEAKEIDIAYQNVTKCTVNFYIMDLELLFSSSPFIKENDSAGLFVSPNFSQIVQLPKDKTSFKVAVPSQFSNANVYIEVLGQGATRCKTFYSNSLSVQVIEPYGTVKVTSKNGNTPLPMTYCKIYARNKDRSVSFYKDGYTDLRGKFDYASLSTNKLPNVDRFSILVMSEVNGACVREAKPPST